MIEGYSPGRSFDLLQEFLAALTHFGVFGPTGDRLDVLPADDLDASYGVIERSRVPLERGTPALVLVPDGASSIAFFAGEREVERRALTLAPEGTTRVNF